MRLTFLGTGTSNGIPIIGCHCPVCTSDDPRDRRSRTSAVIHHNNRNILIDTATELRIQAINAGLDQVDAVLFTHAHADHVGGFDDLRRFNEIGQQHLPVYAGPETARNLSERFGYAFEHHFPFYGGKPDLDLIEFDGPFDLFGDIVTPIPVTHGNWTVHGFRIGPLAYLTDAKHIPDSSIDLLRNADVLVLNALRERSHPTHLSLAEALEVIAEVKPKRAYLVHLAHELSHKAATDQLPGHVSVAWDGLSIDVTASGE
ncbi:MAG: MBL fold metallo-hydrolase [Sphaerobacteraceae bacterium]|nr:MAG: MBL fold metallo-hydrolase [Sphaerobacteraceae bacterium]